MPFLRPTEDSLCENLINADIQMIKLPTLPTLPTLSFTKFTLERSEGFEDRLYIVAILDGDFDPDQNRIGKLKHCPSPSLRSRVKDRLYIELRGVARYEAKQSS